MLFKDHSPKDTLVPAKLNHHQAIKDFGDALQDATDISLACIQIINIFISLDWLRRYKFFPVYPSVKKDIS